MTPYRCYFLGEDGKIRDVDIIQCPTDAAALREAEQKLAASQYPRIEVWDKARRIGIVGRLEGYAGIAAQTRGAGIESALARPAQRPDAPLRRSPEALLGSRKCPEESAQAAPSAEKSG